MRRCIGACFLSAFVAVLVCGCPDTNPPCTREVYFPVAEGRSYRYVTFDDSYNVTGAEVITFEEVAGSNVTLGGPSSLFGGFGEFEFTVSGITIGPEGFQLLRFPFEDGDVWSGGPTWGDDAVTRNVAKVGEFRIYDYYDPWSGIQWNYYDDVFLITTQPTELEGLPTRIWLAPNRGVIAFYLHPDGIYYYQKD